MAPGHFRALTRDNPGPSPEPSIYTALGPSGRALDEDKCGSNLESGGDSHAVLFEVSAYDALFFNLNLTFIVRPMQKEAKALHSKPNMGLTCSEKRRRGRSQCKILQKTRNSLQEWRWMNCCHGLCLHCLRRNQLQDVLAGLLQALPSCPHLVAHTRTTPSSLLPPLLQLPLLPPPSPLPPSWLLVSFCIKVPGRPQGH